MRFFVSSVISGFENQRNAADAAIKSLRQEVIRAEQFQASPTPPQIACLEGVRRSDAVVLIMGERYGQPQASGKSPTHEEFDEAKNSKPIFAFIQSGITPADRQRAFIQEVQQWASGSYTETFSDDADLRNKITSAIHSWIVSSASGSIDSNEMRERAIAALPEERRNYHSRRGPALAISIVGSPQQTILRPSQIESASFQREVKQRALFGSPSVFTTQRATTERIEDHSLILDQEEASLRISEDGSILFVLPLPPAEGPMSPIIEEDAVALLESGLTFASQTLDQIDSTQKLSHIAIAASVLGASSSEWRTRDQHRRNPNSMRMRTHGDETTHVTLSPAHLSRSALKQQTANTAEDLAVLLKRLFQTD